jgi:hypothetical protein
MTVKVLSSLKEVSRNSASLLHAASQNQLQNNTLAAKIFVYVYSERNRSTGRLTSKFSATLAIRFIPYVIYNKSLFIIVHFISVN